ncbi:eCIS core domain-containing protein [Actinopolymorpha pittospori]
MSRARGQQPERSEDVASLTTASARPGGLPHRDRLQRAFGAHDLAAIPATVSPEAAHAARRVHAHAFTLDGVVALPPNASVELAAHEAVHAIEDRGGRAAAGAEERADRLAARAVAGMEIAHELASPLTAVTRPPTGRPELHRAPNQEGTTDPSHVVQWVRAHEGDGSPSEVLEALSDAHGGNEDRYFYTSTYGWVDVRHFGAAASWACSVGSVATEGLGLLNEGVQWMTEWGDSYRSGFSPEDTPSNAAGAEFGDDYVGATEGESLSAALERWMTHAGALDASDPHAGRSALPATDPAVRGGAARGSSNASSRGPAADRGPSFGQILGQIADPAAWARLYGG